VLIVGATALAFVAGLIVGAQLAKLDRVVQQRFQGRLFRVPSRVLSAPTIVYPGLDWRRVELRGLLVRLGYREAAAETTSLPAGAFVWDKSSVRIHLRAFDHPRRAEPDRDIRIALSGGELAEIRELPGERELAAVMLEPEQVGAYYGDDREQRELVRLGDLPRHLIDAVLSVEDQRFDRHLGIDPLRILGALLANLRAGGITQGGSTLTQQLVKNFFLTPERTYTRKLQEAAMALLVELHYDKDAILECYLNEIYLGQRGSTEIHGVGEASRVFFGKPARELDVPEAALIAAVIHSPNGTSPYRDPEAARERRDLVLSLMAEQGRIDQATQEAAKAEPLRLASITPDEGDARFFLDALRRQLPEVYDHEHLVSEGLKIYSTLDLRLQRISARALREGIEAVEKRFKRLADRPPDQRLQGCVVVLRPQTGEVLALVGGREYGQSQFDRCTQARRQGGSLFKPFVYVAALEERGGAPAQITLASRISDDPLTVRVAGSPPWSPQNYDDEFHGVVGVREALEKSMNVATARLAQEVGIEHVVDVARRLGVESPLPLVASLALGSADVTPLEMARAYATIANGGVRPEIRTFEDLVGPEGLTLERRDIGFERVIDAGTAYLATSLMQGVVDRGTAASIRRNGITGPIAGKTGTTNKEVDAWFIGFTPDLVIAIWVGFDTPQPTGLTGGQVAVPVFTSIVREAIGSSVGGAFLPPPEVVEAEDCATGVREFFRAGTDRGCARLDQIAAPREEDRPVTTPTPPRTAEEPRRKRRGFFDWLRGR
jgi:penicillin-binding protein 1B